MRNFAIYVLGNIPPKLRQVNWPPKLRQVNWPPKLRQVNGLAQLARFQTI